jgi:hypothetical protein
VYDVANTDDHGQLENTDDEHLETEESTDEEMNVFQGKDFAWSRTPPKVARVCRENIIVRLLGCVDEEKNANSPHDAFSLFISDDILNIILTNTNKKFMIISSTSLARFRNGCGKHHWMNFVLSLAC